MPKDDTEPEIPEDWDNIEAWDCYHKETVNREGLSVGLSVAFDMLPTSSWLGENSGKKRRVWIPGCGCSISAYLMSWFGHDVWATDFSKNAVFVQQRIAELLTEESVNLDGFLKLLGNKIKLSHTKGSFVTEVHDFRTSPPDSNFDCVLNILSFQGLNRESMRKAAKSHFEALRPGAVAIFSTINVSGERRNTMEDCLTEAGFHIPYNEIRRWYHARLLETGIPHRYMAHTARVNLIEPPYRYLPRKEWELRVSKDQEVLDAITEEYRVRSKAEMDAGDPAENDGNTRIAFIGYNTG